MAWKKSPATTQHTCGGPVFGRLAPRGECRRCDELLFGLPAVQWRTAERRRCESVRLAEIRSHDCKKSGCQVICTFGDW